MKKFLSVILACLILLNTNFSFAQQAESVINQEYKHRLEKYVTQQKDSTIIDGKHYKDVLRRLEEMNRIEEIETQMQ